MLDDVAGKAFERFFDKGLTGVLCVLLILLVIYRERYWVGEIKGERTAHDKTRDALLAEVRSNADTLSLVRTQLQNWQAAVDTLLKVRKDAS